MSGFLISVQLVSVVVNENRRRGRALIARQLCLQQLGLFLELFELFLQRVVLALEEGGAYGYLILLHAASVARSLSRQVVLASTSPILVVLHLVRYELL